MLATAGPNGDPLDKLSENEDIETDSFHFHEERC